MKQNLTERLRTSLARVSPEAELTAIVAGMAVGYPLVFGGLIEVIKVYGNEVAKAIEYICNHPYETAIGVMSFAALGVGTYKYVERKLHVAKTLDDFVERAKRSEAPVDIQFQYGRGLESYEESIMLRVGKIRYESTGKCETFGTGHARGKATGVLSLIETTIDLAGSIQKQGLRVTVNGQTVQYAKDYLVTCQDLVKKGYAFIAG